MDADMGPDRPFTETNDTTRNKFDDRKINPQQNGPSPDRKTTVSISKEMLMKELLKIEDVLFDIKKELMRLKLQVNGNTTEKYIKEKK